MLTHLKSGSLLISMLALFSTTACNYSRMKDESSIRPSARQTHDLGSVDFKLVQTTVLGPRCYGCHTPETGSKGNSNLFSYNDVRAQLGRVNYRALEAKDMPPGNPLSSDEIQILSDWMESGAPEVQIAGAGGEDKQLEQGPTNFAKVRDGIFASKCLSCHQTKLSDTGEILSKAAADLDLTNFMQVRDKVSVIFDRVIVKQDMPVQPLPSLSPRERRVLLKWFELGLPQ